MRIIEFHVENRIGFITLNRPEKRNALNPEIITELTRTFKEANTHAEVKVIILRANGDVFSAGADLAYLQQLQDNSLQDNLADSNLLKDLYISIYTSPKVVIAQVEGHAIAGGCGLATVCDLIFSSPEAKFGYTEVKIGFIPALVSCFLIRRIGESRTKELLLTGDLINAQTAMQYGLINFVIEKNQIRESVIKYAERIAESTSSQSIKLTKELLVFNQNASLLESLEVAASKNAEVRTTEDCRKGITAFLNNEELNW
ncbi:MAG: enoyl-CoA hydratase/isomerase family protein [Sphingobacteriales bacterium]|nr:enoyl-CoA hydratase/isomerase family protein [Sphingobacteriales bacterium]